MDIMNFFRTQWDRATAVIALALGALVMLIGYFGVSGTPFVAKQLPYFISAGMFGLFLLGVAAIAWLSADLRDEWRELRALRGVLEKEFGPIDLVATLQNDRTDAASEAHEDESHSNGSARRRQLRAGS